MAEINESAGWGRAYWCTASALDVETAVHERTTILFGYTDAISAFMAYIIRLPAAPREERPIQEQLLSAEVICDLVAGHLPHLFGQLIWISSFRVGTTDDYRWPAFDRSGCPRITRKALGHTHQRLFTQWIELDFEQQYRDLALYLSSDLSAKQMLSETFRLRKLIPSSASESERLLFISDLEMIMGLVEFV
jgi:hypothetical protein